MPGPLDEAELEARIKASTAVAVMKVGRHFDKVRRVIDRLGLSADAHYIEHASMADQRALPLDQVDTAKAPYFSMILIRRESGEAGQ